MKTSLVDGHNTASPVSMWCLYCHKSSYSQKDRSIIFDDPVCDGTHTTVGHILEAHNNNHKNIKYKIEIQQKNCLSLLYLSMTETSLLLLLYLSMTESSLLLSQTNTSDIILYSMFNHPRVHTLA
jgi:hypothetical protein